jgi:signal transduction histidine kinase
LLVAGVRLALLALVATSFIDPTDVAASSGLTGLRDRLAAIGGTLDVQSAPGSGTTLTAIVPAHR